MTRADRVKRLEVLFGVEAPDAPGSIYSLPLSFVLVAGLRPDYDMKGSIAENLTAALGIAGPADLRQTLRDDPAGVNLASGVRLADMLRSRGAVVPDVPTDADLQSHFGMLDQMLAELPEGVRHAAPFAYAADGFL
jgi:hypothetical protein